MQKIFEDIFTLYKDLLEPFRAPMFGPTVATYLLALALVVFLAFLCFAIPQALRLRAALSKIEGGSEGDSEHEKRATFQSNFDAIDHALLNNKVISSVWKEFRKTLVLRGEQSDAVVWGTARPNIFFNPRSLFVQYDFVRSLPNLFVGLGLLGTFIGLIAALILDGKPHRRRRPRSNQKSAQRAANHSGGQILYLRCRLGRVTCFDSAHKANAEISSWLGA